MTCSPFTAGNWQSASPQPPESRLTAKPALCRWGVVVSVMRRALGANAGAPAAEGGASQGVAAEYQLDLLLGCTPDSIKGEPARQVHAAHPAQGICYWHKRPLRELQLVCHVHPETGHPTVSPACSRPYGPALLPAAWPGWSSRGAYASLCCDRLPQVLAAPCLMARCASACCSSETLCLHKALSACSTQS